jgi:hypothetical protein
MTDKTENCITQALGQLASIREMVANLATARESGDDKAIEDAERVIHEDALSVEVRSGWYDPASLDGDSRDEYRILLCTGGPAVQIIGDLDEHLEPSTATLQAQDWFTPWQDVTIMDVEDNETLLTYARCFYYGE